MVSVDAASSDDQGITGMETRTKDPNQVMLSKCDWLRSRQKRTGRRSKSVEKLVYLPFRSMIHLSHCTPRWMKEAGFTLMMNTVAIMTAKVPYVINTIKAHLTREDMCKGPQATVPLTSTTRRPPTHPSPSPIDRVVVSHNLPLRTVHPRSTSTAVPPRQLYLPPPTTSICRRLRTKIHMGTPRVGLHVSESLNPGFIIYGTYRLLCGRPPTISK